MKKPIIIVYMLCLVNFVYGQSNKFPQKGDNFKNDNIDRFQGDWVWGHNGDTVKIYLKKEDLEVAPEIRADVLVGFHKYIQNGKVVESSYELRNTKEAKKRHTFVGSAEGRSDKIEGIIQDLSSGRSKNVIMTYNPAEDVLNMQLSNRPEIRVNPKEASSTSFSFPESVILKRQK